MKVPRLQRLQTRVHGCRRHKRRCPSANSKTTMMPRLQQLQPGSMAAQPYTEIPFRELENNNDAKAAKTVAWAHGLHNHRQRCPSANSNTTIMPRLQTIYTLVQHTHWIPKPEIHNNNNNNKNKRKNVFKSRVAIRAKFHGNARPWPEV